MHVARKCLSSLALGVAGAMVLLPAPVRAQDARATAAMRDSAGRELGMLTLEESGDGVSVTGRLTGLVPGEHGFHIHTAGSCEPDFEAAGDHWNPTSKRHGSKNLRGPHLGDMPNIEVTPDSSVEVDAETPPGSALAGEGANALLDANGAAVVIHAEPDDYVSDPSGKSGARIACGEVRGGGRGPAGP
jgi:Cu-Zn family superoxide dismutase